MSASITWRNLDQFRSTLSQLPDDLAEEARLVLRNTGEAFLSSLQARYPIGPTGNLVKGLRLTEAKKGRWVDAVRVRSTAFHAHLFEEGTKTKRKALTRHGRALAKPANRGIMPAADIFIPLAIANRRLTRGRLIAVIQRNGFEVHDSGE